MVKGSEAYLRMKLKNARIDAEKWETKVSHIRRELNHAVDMSLMYTNEIINVELMIKERYGSPYDPNRS